MKADSFIVESTRGSKSSNYFSLNFLQILHNLYRILISGNLNFEHNGEPILPVILIIRQIRNKLKLWNLTKPHWRSHASNILSDYSVGTWKLKGHSSLYTGFFFASLQRTFISFLSSSVMHSSLTYYRSVDCVSRCPLSRTLASVNTK